MNNLDLLIELTAYTRNMYKRNLKYLNGNILNENDFIGMAYEKGFDTIEQAIRIVRDAIIHEKRVLIGKIQQRSNQFGIYSKVCNKCKTLKSSQEFQRRTDKRTGYMYYNSLCNECENERKREYYAKSERIRHSSHLRYLRYKQRHKKTLRIKELMIA